MSNSALQVINGGGGALPTLNISNEEKLLSIRNTVAKGANEEEFAMFMHLANTYQLDPFLKEIWFIKYGDKNPTIMVSRDGLRNYAQRQGDMLSFISQEVRQGDNFKFNPITKEIHHEIADGSGQITKAYCIIEREGKPKHVEIVDFIEFFQALSGKNPVWKSHPSSMIRKVVEVIALKKCYTITGLYAPEEMGMQEIIDVTPSEKNQGPQRQRDVSGGANQKDQLTRARKALFATGNDYGFDEERLKEYIGAITTKQSTKELSVEEISLLIACIKKGMEIDEVIAVMAYKFNEIATVALDAKRLKFLIHDIEKWERTAEPIDNDDPTDTNGNKLDLKEEELDF